MFDKNIKKQTNINSQNGNAIGINYGNIFNRTPQTSPKSKSFFSAISLFFATLLRFLKIFK